MNVIIFGNRDAASLAHFYIKNDTKDTVDSFCLDGDYIKESYFEGLPVIPFEEMEHYRAKSCYLFLPIYDNKLRSEKYYKAKEKGYNLYTYVSSKATCWTKHIGDNCFIMEDNTIQPYVVIGNNIILWSGNHVGHHSTIYDHVFVSSHVVISGHVTVGSYSWLGVNACIRDGIQIRKGTTVGMGAVVIKDTEEGTTVVGNPAKPMEKK